MLALFSLVTSSPSGRSQAEQQKPAEKSPETAADKSQVKAPKLPAQIDLLETHVRFEVNGNSRKEIHALVKINDELGARQFARLNFSYNRAFQSVEIPFARITHANGGTSDVLPSAITDNPDPAVVNFPAYQDVRVKAVRILGLAPDDSLEYRVVATTSHHPLAPDFWFEHTFDRSGIALEQVLEIDLPASRDIRLYTASGSPHETHKSGTSLESRITYLWKVHSKDSESTEWPSTANGSDVALSTFQDWGAVVSRVAPRLTFLPTAEIVAKTAEISKATSNTGEKLRALYDFVSKKIRTVDLPFGATGFALRQPMDIVSSEYAVPEEKSALLAALANGEANLAIVTSSTPSAEKVPRISALEKMLVESEIDGREYWLDPALEVAPFGVVASGLRGRPALRLFFRSDSGDFDTVGENLPFLSQQTVKVESALAADGKLISKAKYTMRGDNELVLRMALHQTPKEKWKEVAQLLALSDGFRGQIDNVSASDPYDTREPVRIEYEVEQPKFADWSRKSLRIPALLPLLGLPDSPTKLAAGAKPSPIELGTPLDVQVSMTLHVPEGTGAEVPAGTSVERDFATYSSQYSVNGGVLTASRHINFILKQVPADRTAEYNAFLHAVQNDESQVFTLQRADTAPATTPKP